jgi:EmrB/QacA subfamily drug resistance transporter
MPLAGKMSDAYGNKFTFILCICLFTLGSFFCAIAPNIEILIVARFVQGVGLGGFLPVGTSIIVSQFSNSRQQAIGIMSATFAVGQIVGPNLGGWLTSSFGWQANFWIFVPFGILVLIATLILIPRSKRTASKLDFIGAGILTAMLASIMVAISLMGSSNGQIPWFWVVILFGTGIILLVIFMRRQRKIKNPIIETEVLQEKRFIAANAYNFVLGFALFGITMFIPLYAVSIFGMSTFDSGFVMTPRSIGVLIASALSSLLLVRLGYRKPMIVGTILSLLSLFALGIITPDRLSGWPISNFMFLSLILLVNGIGQGVANPAANNACIELMPDRVGTITGVRGMFRQIGSAIGISLTTLVLHNTANIQHGFFLVMVWTGIILVLCLPVILLIPKNASVKAIIRNKKTELT